jgi:hypothetical protein
VNILAVSKDRKGQSTGDELLLLMIMTVSAALFTILPKWKRAMQGKSMAKKKGETSQWEKSRAIEKELCVRCLSRIARDVYTHKPALSYFRLG